MASPTVQPPNPLTWLIAPALLALVASVVLATPIRVLGLGLPEPVWAMAPAFAWGVIRPSILPAAALLAMGAFLDALWGGAPGLWSLCLLSLYGLVLAVRPILSGQGFWSLFACYVIACAAAFGLGALLTTMASGTTPSLIGVGLQLLATAALFPLAWGIISAFEDADVRFR
jgi:rod shape-determining protein MreD